MANAAMMLGEILLDHGALKPDQLREALTQLRGRLGDFLRSHGFSRARDIARAVAQQQGVAYVDLQTTPPEAHLFQPRDVSVYQRQQFVPWRHRGGVLTLATPEPSERLRSFAQSYYRLPIAFVVTTARDLNHYFTNRAATATTRRSVYALRRLHPGLVADCLLHRHQRYGLLLLGLVLAVGFYHAPHGTWKGMIVACNFFYAATLLIKLEFYRQGCLAARQIETQRTALTAHARALTDAELPTYSILVPLYRESAGVMQRLIERLNALEYPKEKLDIKLIVERDDYATVHALKALAPPETMEIVGVPPSFPRTKPKACNLALQQVRGEFLVVYDAEDAPAPEQLRRAVALFHEGPARLACLQAPLNYYNREENLLTQLFAIEYSTLFRLMLPALGRLNLPIPLGGTSNHLRVAALRDAGGWDAFNVTEDCDLGVRLHYLGYSTAMLPCLTLEEAPIHFMAWLKQRTRWIKGYMQTWLVYMRDARTLKQRLGPPGYYGFQFFIGAPVLTFLFAPVFWFIFLTSLMGAVPFHLPDWLMLMCAFSFVGGALSHWLLARKVLALEGWPRMRLAFFCYPLYWLLHSLAAGRALIQLMVAPHYWEKTTHGVSRSSAKLTS